MHVSKRGKLIIFSCIAKYYDVAKVEMFRRETLACPLLSTRHYKYINKM
jgi:hypothetical protein